LKVWQQRGRDPDQPQQVGIDLLLDHVIVHRLAVGEVVLPLDSGVIDNPVELRKSVGNMSRARPDAGRVGYIITT
jgi:hypothetical protein